MAGRILRVRHGRLAEGGSAMPFIGRGVREVDAYFLSSLNRANPMNRSHFLVGAGR